MEWAYKLVGLAATVTGCVMILLAIGFTTLTAGDRNDPPPAPGVVRVLNHDELGPLLFGGILLGLAGLWLAFRSPEPLA